MKTVPFTLITPTAIAYEGDAELVIVVGTEGEEGILPSHAPFLTALRPGILRANVVEGGAPKRLELATSDGFMQALPERVTVLVDEALRPEQIDAAAARAELEATSERLKLLQPQTLDYERGRAAADFAAAKVSLTS